jgi:hypothetical protein
LYQRPPTDRAPAPASCALSLQRRAHAAHALLGTVALAVSDPADSRSEQGAWRERPERPRARRHRPAWRHAAAALLGIAYAGALAWTSWDSSMATDDGGIAPLLAVASILGWTAVTVLVGYLLRTWAFAIIALAVVIPAFIGEQADEFDEELRYFNWLLLIVINAAIAALGVWVAARRAARAGPTEGRSASTSA